MKRAGAGRKAPVKRKSSRAGRLVLAIVTCCNLVLSVALHLMRRREILHAVETDEGVRLLITSRKETKAPKNVD